MFHFHLVHEVLFRQHPILESQGMLGEFVAEHFVCMLADHGLRDARCDRHGLFDRLLSFLFHKRLHLNIGLLWPVATGRWLQTAGGNSDGDDAACLDDIQAEPLRFGQHFIGFGAWIQPQFVAALCGNIGKQSQKDWRRHVNADHLRAQGDVADAFVSREAFNLRFSWIDGVNGVALLLKCANGFVAEFAPVV